MDEFLEELTQALSEGKTNFTISIGYLENSDLVDYILDDDIEPAVLMNILRSLGFDIRCLDEGIYEINWT